MPRDWKIPNSLTKFYGKNGELTIEHIAQYTIEIGEVASNEYLKMIFFSSFMTRNACTQFSNLRPNSTTTWAQLEASFYSQFFRAKMKVSLTDLFAISQFNAESVNDYLARCQIAQNYCYASVQKAEVVKKAINGLDYRKS